VVIFRSRPSWISVMASFCTIQLAIDAPERRREVKKAGMNRLRGGKIGGPYLVFCPGNSLTKSSEFLED
jgi:hypothetical protein